MARDCTVALIGCGRVGCSFLELVALRRRTVASRIGVRLLVTSVADSGTLFARADGLTDDEIRGVVEAKQSGIPLGSWAEGVASAGGAGGTSERWSVLAPDAADRVKAAHAAGAPDVVVDLTDERSASTLLALRTAGSALVLGNKRPLVEDMPTWRAITEFDPRLRTSRWEATVASSLPVVQVLRALVDSGDTPRSIIGVLSGTLGVLLACVAAGGTPVQGLARAVARGLSEPDPRRDLDGVDTAAKALILARTAGWDAELRGIEREPVGGVDWSTVPTHEVGAELERLGPDLAASLSGDVRYLASVSPSALHVGIGRAPAELAALDPANSAVRIETTGFRAFPLVLSGRGGGSAAAAEAVLADVVAAAGRDGA